MRKQLVLLLLVVVAAAVAARLLGAREASAPPSPSKAGLSLNGIWLGESQADVEAVWGPGSPASATTAERTFTYPKGEDEHVVRVRYDQQGSVSGVSGYELKRGPEKFIVSGSLMALLTSLGDPEQLKVHHFKPGSSVEMIFADGVRVTTTLTQNPDHKLTLPDYIDSISLGQSFWSEVTRPYVGKGMELRKRRPEDSEVTIFCGGVDILR